MEQGYSVSSEVREGVEVFMLREGERALAEVLQLLKAVGTRKAKQAHCNDCCPGHHSHA